MTQFFWTNHRARYRGKGKPTQYRISFDAQSKIVQKGDQYCSWMSARAGSANFFADSLTLGV